MDSAAINKLMREIYGLEAGSVCRAAAGAGSDTFFISCKSGDYVLKFPAVSEMNDPDSEPALCNYLLGKGLPVCRFIPGNGGGFVFRGENGRKFHLQEFIHGKMYGLNQAPPWLMGQSAQMLGRIHTALSGYPGLHEGIGREFFRRMTPENARRSYISTLALAKRRGDGEAQRDLQWRLELMDRFPELDFDLGRLTLRRTHGDYFISQLLCGEECINAVIDWTTACIHPAVWEIIRSFVYASPECADGCFDISGFIGYVENYLAMAPLSKYDLAMMPKLFYYQLAVCDYYGQYYGSVAANRDIYLHQAQFSTKLMRWFDSHIAELESALDAAFDL